MLSSMVNAHECRGLILYSLACPGKALLGLYLNREFVKQDVCFRFNVLMWKTQLSTRVAYQLCKYATELRECRK